MLMRYREGMPYRDDRDALHARNQALEQEVDALRTRQEHTEREHARELANARAGVSPKPSYAGLRGLAWTVGGALATTSALYCALRVPSAPFQMPPPAMQMQPVKLQPALPPLMPAPTRVSTLRVVWHATVQEARGIALHKGRPCLVEAETTSSGVLADSPVLSTRISCGTTMLYDSLDPARGESSATARFEQGAPPTSPHYDPFGDSAGVNLRYDEAGTVGRALPRASIATKQGSVLLLRDKPALRVELRVEPGSGIVRSVHAPRNDQP